MNLKSFTTDDLLAAIPADEDDKWERKSASLLTQKNPLKLELGKQVSAFANSGGGYLVFGIDDKSGQLEPCEQVHGNQTMKDYLSTMTEQAVEYPIQDFRVHRIPFTGETEKSVYVVEIGDSVAAPHQAKEEKKYYYRIDGHSKLAPHFYLELLRNRLTRSVLEIKDIYYTVQTPDGNIQDGWNLNVLLQVEVENISMQCASKWGVLLKTPDGDGRWMHSKSKKLLADGIMLRGEEADLLPFERVVLPVHVAGFTQSNARSAMARLWGQFDLSLRPVSHDHVGAEVLYGKRAEDIWAVNEEHKMRRELEHRYGSDYW